nr:hypothetical protein CFP56_54302 [Quercus suber]
MIVSRRRYGQKGIRTGHGTGNGTEGASSQTWTPPFHLTPEFAERTYLPVGGPSSSKSVPRKISNPKAGAVTKNGGKIKKQDISPGLSHRVHKSYPSSVKDKKTVARNLASDTPSKSVATSCLEGLARKLTTLSPTSPPSPCFDPK